MAVLKCSNKQQKHNKNRLDDDAQQYTSHIAPSHHADKRLQSMHNNTHRT